MKKMILNEIIATKSSEVGISWFDFFSIGHICFGIGVFLFFSLFYTIPKAKGRTPLFSLFFVFILSFIIFIAWEIVENTLLLNLKFGGRDSWQNIFTDIMFGILGALGTWIFAYVTFEKDRKIWPYYIFGIIGFLLWIIVFGIFGFITVRIS